MKLLLAVGFLLVHCASAGAAAEKPNLVLILVDNVGYGDLGCYGNRKIKTPHIDHLAEQGELFDLETDVGETANLAAREPETVERLSSEFQHWYEDARHESAPPGLVSAVQMLQFLGESSKSSSLNGRQLRRESR